MKDDHIVRYLVLQRMYVLQRFRREIEPGALGMRVLHPMVLYRMALEQVAGYRTGKAGSQRLRKGVGAPYSPDLVGAKVRPGRRRQPQPDYRP
jgi:hypothetical protein